MAANILVVVVVVVVGEEMEGIRGVVR